MHFASCRRLDAVGAHGLNSRYVRDAESEVSPDSFEQTFGDDIHDHFASTDLSFQTQFGNNEERSLKTHKSHPIRFPDENDNPESNQNEFLDLKSFSNKLILDLFLIPTTKAPVTTTTVRTEPLPIFSSVPHLEEEQFTLPVQNVRSNILSTTDRNQLSSNLPISVPTSTSKTFLAVKDFLPDLTTTTFPSTVSQSKFQSTTPKTVTDQQFNRETQNSGIPDSNSQFPNFPRSGFRNEAKEKVTPRPLTRVTTKQPKKLRPLQRDSTRSLRIRVKNQDIENKRKAAGIKRRKQLFDSGERRRKLLDSKRRVLSTKVLLRENKKTDVVENEDSKFTVEETVEDEKFLDDSTIRNENKILSAVNEIQSFLQENKVQFTRFIKT